ncbi:RNA polymerase sigma factor SigE [Tessaracoccus flavus]|jgi:RNA polymerase sigma-70 factor (ECF subfamily)|uniref:RNA polymerase sigma factor SigE n=1 Tax=Tessaracoccus flavus TaxID=1610493 RepID=A0A1Q2CG78_9ACTN|nr:RNA polymerase sigma factor SigE [Tessaracoccus flavus]AQP45107.1 RNA polymerase sigma factor SigE [Tessaracoccus flavus]SDY56275.1 RNA polymerase sigma-70 factor, ECF subfamily [Tessaracoccus flavus]
MFRGRGAKKVTDSSWTAPTWQELVRDHSTQVYRLAYRLTGNQHDAEDLTQDVFVRVFKSIHTFQPGTLEGWLHRITTNLFLDQARRRQRIRMDALSTAPDHVWGSSTGPAELHNDAELDADVAAALKALNPEQRVAVVLCDIEGLSYEEIAEVLDVKLGTVRSRIARGRAALRDSLAHRAPTEGRSRYLGVS